MCKFLFYRRRWRSTIQYLFWWILFEVLAVTLDLFIIDKRSVNIIISKNIYDLGKLVLIIIYLSGRIFILLSRFLFNSWWLRITWGACEEQAIYALFLDILSTIYEFLVLICEFDAFSHCATDAPDVTCEGVVSLSYDDLWRSIPSLEKVWSKLAWYVYLFEFLSCFIESWYSLRLPWLTILIYLKT